MLVYSISYSILLNVKAFPRPEVTTMMIARAVQKMFVTTYSVAYGHVFVCVYIVQHHFLRCVKNLKINYV